MAAASYYQGGTPSEPTYTTEMYNIPSPDPSYSRPQGSPNPAHDRPHSSQQDYLNPAGYAPSGSVPQTPKPSGGMTRQARALLEKLKRWIRVLQIVAQACTVLFTLIMFGIMIYVNEKFYTTKGLVRDGRTAWPQGGTKEWPSIMLLAASGLTLLMSVVLLFGYCCCWKKTKTSWKFTVFRYVVQIAAWIMVSVIYRYEKGLHGNDNDLWGWSCSTKAKDIQETFNGVVDFSSLCKAQGGSWNVSIAEVVVKILFAIGHFYIYRKKEPLEKQNFADRIVSGRKERKI
ncbi:MAG: hypothetical protein Q9195_003585 [Heterodermia aff. obscurata]